MTDAPIHKLMAKTLNSEAVKSLKFRINVVAPVGSCRIVGCRTKSRSLMALWCKLHEKLLKRERMRLNNIAWRKRQKAGKAKRYGKPARKAARRAKMQEATLLIPATAIASSS